MALKTEFIITIIVYYLTGIGAQNPSCSQIDFNNTDSINEFEMCTSTPRMFIIKSYEDVAIVPFGDDVKYHLTNAQAGFTCLVTSQPFELDDNTEFHAMIYLSSIDDGDPSEISIKLINRDIEFNLETVKVSTEWYELNKILGFSLEGAKIEISGQMEVNAVLAIEYLHILNPLKGEEDCEITFTTDETETTTDETETTTDETETTTDETETTTDETETTTDETETTTDETETTTDETETTIDETETTIDETETTTDETETTTDETETTTDETETTTDETETTIDETETTTDETEITTDETTTTTPSTTLPTETPPNPINSNESSKWKILSFTFLLTTVIVMAASIYLFYLYKSALVTKTMMFKAPVTRSNPISLPRLTVATSNNGDQVIVAIKNIQYKGVKKF